MEIGIVINTLKPYFLLLYIITKNSTKNYTYNITTYIKQQKSY
jgi:hypothetical protein